MEVPRMNGSGTLATDGTDHRPSMSDDRMETILDSIATANRIGRANAAALWRMENALVFLGILALTLYWKGRK